MKYRFIDVDNRKDPSKSNDNGGGGFTVPGRLNDGTRSISFDELLIDNNAYILKGVFYLT